MSQKCIISSVVEDLKKKLLSGKLSTDEISKLLPQEKAELKVLLEEFVTEKLGVKISDKEMSQIDKYAKVIDEYQKKLGDNLGNPQFYKQNIDFLKSKEIMNNYISSLNPSSKTRVWTGTIGSGVMLLSLKSPILNIGSNAEVGITEAIVRRLANRRIKGTDNQLAKDFVKMNRAIFRQTGFDLSRMTALGNNDIIIGEKVAHSQGNGVTGAIGRTVENVVFDYSLGRPDVFFASNHFADSVNLGSLSMAKGDKAKAREFMLDSMLVEPKTAEGGILRNQGILDAQVATWTNKTWASTLSSGIRQTLNSVTGDARLGDYVFPFVKTGSNVIATGIDYAGGGIPKALFKLVKTLKSGEKMSDEVAKNIIRDVVRSGIGIGAALIITNFVDESDFMGAYDPTRAQIETLKNSTTNSIKLFGKWVSTDWLGPLAIPITAMMYAKKYGKKGGAEAVFQYVSGTGSQALNIPGVADIYDTVKSVVFKQNQTLDEMGGNTINYVVSQASSRLIPSIFSDVAKAIDPYDRKTSGVDAVLTKIPGASYLLPAKQDIFGEKIQNEPGWSSLLFGSRVKTAKDDNIVQELDRVSKSVDKGINFTDWSKSSSKSLDQFKQSVGDVKFNQAKTEYGKNLKQKLDTLIKNSTYKNLSDEDKLKEINGKDTETIDQIYKKYGFKYKSATNKLPSGL